jgi:PKD repeat protein
VTLSAAGSFDPDDNLSQFLWDFGDGSSGSGLLVQHTYAQGSYTATLKVVDDRGASATAKAAIGVNNNPPNIVAGATPDAGLPPLALLFTAAGSTDSDGAIIDFAWDFGDGTTGKGAVISHTYPAPGLYFAKIKVTDNGGATAERMINVLVGITVTPASGRFGLNFKRIAADKFNVQIKGLPVDPTLLLAGLSGSVIVGNAEFPFTLSDKGKFNLSPLSIQFTPAKGTLKVTVSRTALDGALANSGAGNFDSKNAFLRVPFAVVFNNGTVFGSTGVSFSYTARRGASGNGKLMK